MARNVGSGAAPGGHWCQMAVSQCVLLWFSSQQSAGLSIKAGSVCRPERSVFQPPRTAPMASARTFQLRRPPLIPCEPRNPPAAASWTSSTRNSATTFRSRVVRTSKASSSVNRSGSFARWDLILSGTRQARWRQLEGRLAMPGVTNESSSERETYRKDPAVVELME